MRYREQAVKDMVGEGFDVEDMQISLEAVLSSNGEKQVLQSQRTSGGSRDVREALINSLFSKEAKGATLETLSLAAECKVVHWEPVAVEKADVGIDQATKGVREVYWEKEKPTDSPIYDREKLRYGHTIQGPAVVEGTDTNYPVARGWALQVDELGNFVITRSS
ncbi:hydantoinase/oxoprolinase family protein [Rubrobacter marinus]